MCRMTEKHVRAHRMLPMLPGGRYLVCRGNHTGDEFYVSSERAAAKVGELSPFKPLYRINVRERMTPQLKAWREYQHSSGSF